MRQIKFRGKRKDYGYWLYGDYCSLPNSTILFISEKQAVDFERVITETVGQFTGLTDKDGKEIYEGDIMSNGTSDYTIEYRNGAFRLIRHDISCYVISDVDISEFEIIGNIHDTSHTNPER